MEWHDPTMKINSDTYKEAIKIHQNAKNRATTVENRARHLLPLKFAGELFAHLHRCRTRNSRLKALTMIAGICNALAFELAEEIENERKQNGRTWKEV